MHLTHIGSWLLGSCCRLDSGFGIASSGCTFHAIGFMFQNLTLGARTRFIAWTTRNVMFLRIFWRDTGARPVSRAGAFFKYILQNSTCWMTGVTFLTVIVRWRRYREIGTQVDGVL